MPSYVLTGTPGAGKTAILRQRVYQPTALFVRNQGFVRATPARRISFADALRFERIHEQTYLELGFRLVEVAAAPLADRVALVERSIQRLQPRTVPQPPADAAVRADARGAAGTA